MLLRSRIETAPISELIPEMVANGYGFECKVSIGTAPESGYFGVPYYVVAFHQYRVNYAVNQAAFSTSYDDGVRQAALTAFDLVRNMENNSPHPLQIGWTENKDVKLPEWEHRYVSHAPEYASVGIAYPNKIPDEIMSYVGWFEKSYGWNPFAELTCGRCKKSVPLIQVYRCYDCALPMHRHCLKAHCAESPPSI